jgi:hypothetical protein
MLNAILAERLLVITSDAKSEGQYSQLESYLRASYKQVTIKTAKNAPKLFKDGGLSYDHLLLLTSKLSSTLHLSTNINLFT